MDHPYFEKREIARLVEDHVPRRHSDHDCDTWEFVRALTCLTIQANIDASMYHDDALNIRASPAINLLTWLKAVL